MSLLTHFAHTGHVHPTEAENAAVAGLLFFVIILTILAYILTSIMLARIFKKAGVAGWKAWVPVYNSWVTLELGGQKGWWSVLLLFPFISIIAMIFLYIAMYRIGLHLGKEGYFVLWAIFLPLIWYAWLAFDKSTWKTTTPPTVSDPTDPARQ